MENEILELIKQRDYVSFVELIREIPSATGDCELVINGERGTYFLWGGLSKECCNLLTKMRDENKIHFSPSSRMVYYIDGAFPDLPVPKRLPKKGGKKTWWIPVTLRLGADNKKEKFL